MSICVGLAERFNDRVARVSPSARLQQLWQGQEGANMMCIDEADEETTLRVGDVTLDGGLTLGDDAKTSIRTRETREE